MPADYFNSAKPVPVNPLPASSSGNMIPDLTHVYINVELQKETETDLCTLQESHG